MGQFLRLHRLRGIHQAVHSGAVQATLLNQVYGPRHQRGRLVCDSLGCQHLCRGDVELRPCGDVLGPIAEGGLHRPSEILLRHANSEHHFGSGHPHHADESRLVPPDRQIPEIPSLGSFPCWWLVWPCSPNSRMNTV